MTAEAQLVRQLSDAHAFERALARTLADHVAVTPRSEYRDLLERHLEQTRQHAGALAGRLGELGAGPGPVELVVGLAQTALGQVVAAGRLPLGLLRGTGGAEQLLRNARGEAACAALQLATYDAIEALAAVTGDGRSAVLARAHGAQAEAFLTDLRAAIGPLARDAVGAGSGLEEDPSAEPPLPIEDYDELPVQRIVPKLRLLTVPELRRVEAHERAGRARKAVLDRITTLRAQTNGSRPLRAPGTS